MITFARRFIIIIIGFVRLLHPRLRRVLAMTINFIYAAAAVAAFVPLVPASLPVAAFESFSAN